jgi:hypothetical protein
MISSVPLLFHLEVEHLFMAEQIQARDDPMESLHRPFHRLRPSRLFHDSYA